MQQQINEILGKDFWPENLKTNVAYVTTHDDNDGDPTSGFLGISIDSQGDANVWIKGSQLRFRISDGGGKFHKIRNALLILADAIRQEGKT